MKAYVFTDKALQRHAGQFVWLSLDVEKGQNAPYKKKYGIDALPMYFVVDPKTEKIALRWVGGATVPQLQKILGDGLTAVKGGGRGVEEVLARADRVVADSLPVIAAGSIQFRRGGLMAATLSTVLYVGLVIAQYLAASGYRTDPWLNAATLTLPPASVARYTVALNVFGFFAVALLSGSLAERARRGEPLALTLSGERAAVTLVAERPGLAQRFARALGLRSRARAHDLLQTL